MIFSVEALKTHWCCTNVWSVKDKGNISICQTDSVIDYDRFWALSSARTKNRTPLGLECSVREKNSMLIVF